MKSMRYAAAFATSLLLAGPVAAQQTGEGQTTGDQQTMTDEEMAEAGTAAETMVGEVYVRELPTYWSPEEVISRLRELGYSNFRDFDVEWGHYEVEATTETGEDVEIEIDPVTGTIIDVEENWF